MYVERKINPVESVSLKNNLSKDTRFSESFHDIFQKSLNSKANTRPFKIEFVGLLIPINQKVQGRTFRFKLQAESDEYFLSMNNELVQAAQSDLTPLT